MSFVLLALILAVTTAGCACLALAQAKPWMAVYGRTGPKRQNGRNFLLIGYSLLGFSLMLSILRETVEMAFLLWPLTLALTGTAVIMALSYRPEWFTRPGLWIDGLALPFGPVIEEKDSK
ncbi:MAG: DUF3325 domain-containing protein [Pseudomonadota bacterium]